MQPTGDRDTLLLLLSCVVQLVDSPNDFVKRLALSLLPKLIVDSLNCEFSDGKFQPFILILRKAFRTSAPILFTVVGPLAARFLHPPIGTDGDALFELLASVVANTSLPPDAAVAILDGCSSALEEFHPKAILLGGAVWRQLGPSSHLSSLVDKLFALESVTDRRPSEFMAWPDRPPPPIRLVETVSPFRRRRHSANRSLFYLAQQPRLLTALWRCWGLPWTAAHLFLTKRSGTSQRVALARLFCT
jgi:hypothetical protein